MVQLGSAGLRQVHLHVPCDMCHSAMRKCSVHRDGHRRCASNNIMPSTWCACSHAQDEALTLQLLGSAEPAGG